jgi:hypothetical protein
MGVLTLYGTKKLHKKNSPAYLGILTLYGAKKHMENSHMISINIHGIFPSIDRKKHRTTGEY